MSDLNKALDKRDNLIDRVEDLERKVVQSRGFVKTDEKAFMAAEGEEAERKYETLKESEQYLAEVKAELSIARKELKAARAEVEELRNK